MRNRDPKYLLELHGKVESDYLYVGAGVGGPFSLEEHAQKISELLEMMSLEEVMRRVREMRRHPRVTRHGFFRINGVCTIPASSIKGALLASERARRILGDLEKWSGSTGNPSLLNFTNAQVIGETKWISIRREIRGRTFLIEYEVIPRGATFEFRVLSFSEELDKLRELFEGELKIGAMKNEEFDGKKFGVVKLDIKKVEKL